MILFIVVVVCGCPQVRHTHKVCMNFIIRIVSYRSTVHCGYENRTGVTRYDVMRFYLLLSLESFPFEQAMNVKQQQQENRKTLDVKVWLPLLLLTCFIYIICIPLLLIYCCLVVFGCSSCPIVVYPVPSSRPRYLEDATASSESCVGIRVGRAACTSRSTGGARHRSSVF